MMRRRNSNSPGSSAFVFVHGTPSDSRLWDRVAEHAPPDRMLSILDLPDHRPSNQAPGTTLADLESVIVGAVERASALVTLVGHSFGA